MSEKKILVAGPYLGELGWELFAWQPMVRAQWLEYQPDRTVVYTSPGREKFYRFADEVRSLINLPELESECMAWTNLHQHKDVWRRAIDSVKRTTIQEFPEKQGYKIRLFNTDILKALNQPYYERGEPDLLRGDGAEANALLGDPDERRIVALCVRDREMSDFRNWSYDNWFKLGQALIGDGWTPVYLGKIRSPERWKVPQGSIDLTNRTTLDQALSVLSERSELAIGGSTGLTHLASRAGVDHIVWGVPKNVVRYYETNWFGARFMVLPNGWTVNPSHVIMQVRKMDD